MKSVEEINEGYRAEGWGKLAEHLGYNPYYMDDKAVGVVKDVYEKLMEPNGDAELRFVVKGKRVRTALINDTMYGPKEVESIREEIIELRNGALSSGQMQWALLLSINIALLQVLAQMLDCNIDIKDGEKWLEENK